jgi:polysaccharide transporter, PST family
VPKERSFVHGALLLAGAAVITKLLGSVYTIILQNVIGDHGMGLFQMAYPIYATLLAIATAGFPVAISKLVSERLALNDAAGARQVLRVSLNTLSILGIASFCILFFGAEFWARTAGDPAAKTAIEAISPALLIVPVLSALRGYFQGYQWMEPTASSQVIEQFVRVVTIIGLAVWLTNAGFAKSITVAGAAFGAVTGALGGLVAIGYYFLHRPKETIQARTAPVTRATTRFLTRRLIHYAFPICLGALVVPLMNNVDVMTVVNLLKGTGESQGLATTEFGLLSGRAFKLMMLPTTLAAGIGIAVMPAISEAFTLGYRRLLSTRVHLALRMTILLALPATVGLIVVAVPVNYALFRDGAGTATIQVLALAILFASLQTTVAAILQGAGWVYLPVIHLLIACVIKLLANLWFVPLFGIWGAGLATVISYLVASILNLVAMVRLLGESIDWTVWFVKPLTATFIMFGAVFALYHLWLNYGGIELGRGATALSSIVIMSIGILVYGIAVLVSGSLTSEELYSFPKVGPKLVSWCTKFGFIR